VIGGLLELLFPSPCPGCGRPGTAGSFCGPCATVVELLPSRRCTLCAEPLPPPLAVGAGGPLVLPGELPEGRGERCASCARHPPAFSRALVPFAHGGAVADAIHRLKYRGRREVARSLAALVVPPAAVHLAGATALAPIPLHPARRRERGYDQALLLAREAARLARVPLAPNLLTRARSTRPQVGLSRAERIANVAGAFSARPCSGRVVLVDDVLTTGATASAAASALLVAGADEVFLLAVARAAG
jgi:ComF family protein